MLPDTRPLPKIADIEFMDGLVLQLQEMYVEIANAHNKLQRDFSTLKARYDAHTTHPPV